VILTAHACVVLDLAREQRAAALELAQHVAPEPGVLFQERAHAELARSGFPLAPHPREQNRQVLDRIDERVDLDELPLLPEQPLEPGSVEGPEPAPEDEVLRRRHGRDGVDLKEAEPADGLEDVRRRAVEELRAHGDPARPVL
jgi:hypothetical protein